MKLVFVLCVAVAAAAAAPADTYSTKYDNIDLDAILSNNRVLGNYIKCLLDKAPCTAEGRELRQHIGDAIQTNCERCTDTQKTLVRKASSYVMEHRPDDWKLLEVKYDPKGEHKETFQKFLHEE